MREERRLRMAKGGRSATPSFFQNPRMTVDGGPVVSRWAPQHTWGQLSFGRDGPSSSAWPAMESRRAVEDGVITIAMP